jgi:hypothetical protein
MELIIMNSVLTYSIKLEFKNQEDKLASESIKML